MGTEALLFPPSQAGQGSAVHQGSLHSRSFQVPLLATVHSVEDTPHPCEWWVGFYDLGELKSEAESDRKMGSWSSSEGSSSYLWLKSTSNMACLVLPRWKTVATVAQNMSCHNLCVFITVKRHQVYHLNKIFGIQASVFNYIHNDVCVSSCVIIGYFQAFHHPDRTLSVNHKPLPGPQPPPVPSHPLPTSTLHPCLPFSHSPVSGYLPTHSHLYLFSISR